MKDINKSTEILISVSEIVAAYVSNHNIKPEELPGLMALVHKSLCTLNTGPRAPLSLPSEPAVPIKDSVNPDFLVCLEDGRKLKMLKRHLKTSYNMTPDQYRERWSLPSDYPMVAPNYAKTRQSIAKNIGLGTHKIKREKAA